MRIGKIIESNSFKDSNLANILRDIIIAVDGKLSKEDNLQGKVIKNFFFQFPDFDYPLTHDLGRLVTHYVVLNKNKFADFRLGEVAPTNNRLYLRCNTADTTADIFIWG